MTVAEILDRLEGLGNEKVRSMNAKNGISQNQYGVRLGDIRIVAKEIKPSNELARELWKTGNHEAMLLAVLVMKPKDIPVEELDELVRSVPFSPSLSLNQLADWLTSYVVKMHPEKEVLRQRWMESTDTMAARAGWSLTAESVAKNPEGLSLDGLLDRIEREMPDAPVPVQWTMNFCLAEIGIRCPEYRKRAVAIGEKLGVFRDYPTPKGCTSPFAPLWIAEIVRRQE